MDYDEKKFRELLLYVAKRLEDDPTAGATKLNKVLFFAEFAHMREHGRPITGAEYQRLPWGPAPRRLRPVRRDLEQSGEAEVREDSYLGYPQHRLVPLRDPEPGIFTDSEVKAIEDALHELRFMNAKQASDLSHEEVGWQKAAEGQTIPYEAALLGPPMRNERTLARARELAQRLANR